MSNRRFDMQIEEAYSRRVLIPELYSNLLDMKEILSFKKETSVERQKMGIDMVLEKESGNSYSEVLYVDEKTPFNYLNGNLKTFAFELSFLSSKGDEICGWFLNKSLMTTHYLCSYPRYRLPLPRRYKVSSLSVDCFCNIDALMIPKKSVVNMLDSFGITHDSLKNENAWMRQSNAERPRIDLCNGIYIRKSTGLSEQPINIIIPKDLLIDIACSRFMIRGSGGFVLVK